MKKLLCFFLTISLILCFSLQSFADGRAALRHEIENNNSFYTANVIKQDESWYGKILTSGDVDYYKVTFTMPGSVNIWLGNIPSDQDYDLYVYDSNYQLLWSSTGTGTQEFIQTSISNANTTFYIKVLGFGGSCSTTQEYCLRTKLRLNHYTYYNMQRSTDCGIDSYSVNGLSSLGVKIGNTLQNYTWLEDIQRYGCWISSLAMIIKNLDEETVNELYDYRNGVTYNLIADPYTVSLVNAGTVRYSSYQNQTVATVSNEPVSTNRNHIESGFNVSLDYHVFRNMTETQIANQIANLLVDNPQGIMVYFNNSTWGSHAVVFVSTDYEATEPLYNTQTRSIVFPKRSFDYITDVQAELMDANIDEFTRDYRNMFYVFDPVDASPSLSPVPMSDNGIYIRHYNFSDALGCITVN